MSTGMTQTITQGIVRFLLAVLLGTLAGVIVLFGWIALVEGDISWEDVPAGLLFLTTFTALFTGAGMVVIGLPVTVLLAWRRWEQAWVYALLGTLAGFIATALAIGLDKLNLGDGLVMPITGAIAGLAASYSWGRWRERSAS